MARRTLVDLRHVQVFMEIVLPPTMPPKQQRTQLLRFYGWLCGHSGQQFGIVLVCPHCNRYRGRCTCPQMGYQMEGDGDSRWVYDISMSYAHWQINVRSLLQIDTTKLNSTSAAERRLAEFIAYVKRLAA